MSYKTRRDFIDSEQASEVKRQLEEMTKNPKYVTKTSYSANTDKYPDHKISFVDKHMDYIVSHPDVAIDYYLSNLKLSILVR